MYKLFTKRYANRELFEEALENSLEAYRVSLEAQYLRVPKVMNYDECNLEISFEYMDHWTQLTFLIRDYGFLRLPAAEVESIFFRVGSALLEYHESTGKIHRDFDSTNVMFKRGEQKICIIDFSRPDFADYPGYNRGSIYWDLALMVIHLRIKYPPNKLHCLIRPVNRSISRAFLRGYFSLSKLPYNHTEFLEQYNDCLRLEYIRKTFVVRFLLWTPIFDVRDLKL